MTKSKGKGKKGSLGKLGKGVGYRVRSTQTGETKSYKSGKDAAAGAAPIAVENLGTKTTPADIPTLPTPKDPGDLTGMGMESLASSLGDIGLSLDSNKKFVYDPKKSETENAINQSNTTAFQQLMSRLGLQQAPESKTDLYAQTYGVSPEQAQRDYQRQRKDVQNYTSQLNSIVSNSQAQQLALEGQGRGQTSSFVGGEQARINREAAIAALPIQAQLATSQANLEEATRHLDNLFKLKSEDADAQYNFKNKLIDAVYDFASQAQQNVLNAKLSDIKDKRAIEQQNLARADEWAKIAMQTGQTGVMAGFAALNPSSPTFQQDFARLQGQVRKPVEVTQPKAPDLQNFGTADNPDWREYNPTTGRWQEVAGVDIGTGSNLSKVQKTKLSDSIAANQELNKVVSEYKTLLDDVGFEGSTRGGTNLGKYKALKARMTTILKSAETLGTLDEGVRQLVNDLVGDFPEKGGMTQNLFGFKSRMISSQLATTQRLIEESIAEKEKRLQGEGLGFDLTPEDAASIYDLFGVSQTTSSVFNPDDYLIQ